jgi:signal transduction histidine kinase
METFRANASVAVNETPVSRRGARRPLLRLLPAWERTCIDELAVQGRPVGHLLGVAATLGVLTIPWVAHATGITLREVGCVFGVNAVWVLGADLFLYRQAQRSRFAFYALAIGTVLQGLFICLSLVALTGEPFTPLWVALILMACIVGAAEAEASLLFGVLHPLAPLATVPLFLARGLPLSRALPGPLIASFAAGYGYWSSARRREHWRRDRHQREMEFAATRLRELERERARLSRDLHDSVGTTLSLVALYGTLAEDQSVEVGEARRLAATIRDAARTGLAELRGVLLALPQSPATLRELAVGMALFAQRTVEPAGATLSVDVGQGATAVVSGDLRSTLVRVFQEAVHNAVRHGQARHISVRLSATDGRIELEVADDGLGFDPKAPPNGMGIAGIRERAREVGGEVTVESASGHGARVLLELPLPTAAPP